MKKPILMLAALTVTLAACDVPTTTGGVSDLPEEVLALVGPYQNTSNVRVNELDGCYEYLHAGPVESTYLPLRTKDGRPICTRAPEEQAAG